MNSDETRPSWGSLWGQGVLKRVWFLHPKHAITVNLSPSMAFNVIGTAAKPSTQRLHLRNVFAQGRRYLIQSIGKDSFQLVTTSKVLWNYRGRTNPVSIMNGTFTPVGEQSTRVELHSRIKVTYLLDFLLLPMFITSLIISMPWGMPVIAALIVALFTLSWLSHRYNAVLEAQEMLFFVEKALEEYLPRPKELLVEGSDLVLKGQTRFASAWDKFYEDVLKEDKQP